MYIWISSWSLFLTMCSFDYKTTYIWATLDILSWIIACTSYTSQVLLKKIGLLKWMARLSRFSIFFNIKFQKVAHICFFSQESNLSWEEYCWKFQGFLLACTFYRTYFFMGETVIFLLSSFFFLRHCQLQPLASWIFCPDYNLVTLCSKIFHTF